MYNKLFDRKQTTLSISLLALLLSGCSGGFGGGEFKRKVDIHNDTFKISAVKYNQVYTSISSNRDDATTYINSKGKPATDLVNLPAVNYIARNSSVTTVTSEAQNLDFLNLGGGVEINLKQMIINEKDKYALPSLKERKTEKELEHVICCSYSEDNVETPFEFLRFGRYWKRGDGNYIQGFGPKDAISEDERFIAGYLTPKENMPKEGRVYFAGQWYGTAQDNETSTSSQYADARYLVDFKNNSVQGYLYPQNKGTVTKNVVHDIQQAQQAGSSFDGIKFNATISGNGFTDNHAVVNWLSVDSESDEGKKYVKGTAKVDGHFFGTADYPADELGGTIVNKDIQLTAVFAGKRTAQQQ